MFSGEPRRPNSKKTEIPGFSKLIFQKYCFLYIDFGQRLYILVSIAMVIVFRWYTLVFIDSWGHVCAIYHNEKIERAHSDNTHLHRKGEIENRERTNSQTHRSSLWHPGSPNYRNNLNIHSCRPIYYYFILQILSIQTYKFVIYRRRK